MSNLPVKGFVFDVHRSSLMDGPGIRTTIFLKGCPLRCKWCHNPESQSDSPVLSFRAELCTGCRKCETACPNGVHHFVGTRHEIRRGLCAATEQCVSGCPSGALSLQGRWADVSELMEPVERDRVFYEASGGGLTLSGGEPLHQPDFAIALLTEAKRREIHTCVETCGHVPPAILLAAGQVTDHFLFDVKAVDPVKHHALTGVDNGLILQNLSAVLASGATVTVRCPMIPGVNDSIADLKALGALLGTHPGIKGVELLSYHATGNAKYERIGRPIPELDTHLPERGEQEVWLATLRQTCPMGVTLA